MIVIGFILLLTGLVMNVQVLLRLRRHLTPQQIMHTPPWLISAGLVAVGFLLLAIAGG